MPVALPLPFRAWLKSGWSRRRIERL